MANLVRSKMIPQIEMETAISDIDLNPIDVVEKLGKYQFVYDYNAVPAPIFYNVAQNLNVDQNMFNASIKSIQKPVLVKEGGSNANMIAPIWAGLPQNLGQSLPQPVSVNANPQVGVFSKGDIVNVIRFEGSNAIIENPNYVALETTNVKPSWISLLSQNVINKSEFMIPKEYLMKVKDNFLVTIQTGINFGANLKPQPVITVKPIYDTTLEQNATFVLTKDFDYISGYIPRVCPPNELCKGGMVEQYSVLKSGTKVSGRLFSKYIQGFSGGIGSAYRPDIQQNVLKVEGYGSQGSIEIPIDYLTRFLVTVVSLVDKKIGKCNETGLIQTMDYNPCRVSAVKGETYKGYISGGSFHTTDGKTFIPINEYKIIEENSGIVVPVSNDNNNLLLIAGAVILGYALFSNDESE